MLTKLLPFYYFSHIIRMRDFLDQVDRQSIGQLRRTGFLHALTAARPEKGLDAN